MKTNPHQVLLGMEDGERQGWMDGQEDTEEEKRRGRAARRVIQEESFSLRADQSQSFVSGLIFSSEVVSRPSLYSPRQSVAPSRLFRLGHFN